MYPGSTVSYSYTNNTGTASNIVWGSQNANPPGSITFTGSGSTVSVTFASNFVSGSISADGSNGTALTCNTILNVTKAQAICCVPTMHLSFVCRGSSPTGNLGGFLTLIPPSNCAIDWNNNVSQIDFKLEGGPSFSGDDVLNGTKAGTLYPPFTSLNDNKINQEFYYTGCLSRVTAKVTIYFKNGCPPVSLNAEALRQ